MTDGACRRKANSRDGETRSEDGYASSGDARITSGRESRFESAGRVTPPSFGAKAEERGGNMPIRDVALALLVVAIWGFNFVAIKVGVGEVPPLFLTSLRFLCAAVPAVFFLPRPACRWYWVVAFGLVLCVAKFSLLLVGIKWGMLAGLSSLVLQTQAFFTMGLAVVLLGDRPKPVQIAGAIVAGLGIAVIASTRTQGASLVPFVMVLGAAACWGLANIVAKKAGRVDMVAFVVWASLVAPIPLFLMALVFEGWDAMSASLGSMNLLTLSTILYQAWPTTILGFAIWNGLLGRHPLATVAPFSLLVPVFGISSAALVLGEPMGVHEAIGGAIVFAGLVINVFGPGWAARLRRA